MAERASPSVPAALSGRMPGHGFKVRENNREEVIGLGMLGFLSDATVTTPSDPTFGAVGSRRGLVGIRQGSSATAGGVQQACSEEHVGSDIGSRTSGGESRGISEGTRIEEVRLAVRLVEDSARQLGMLKQSRLNRRMALR